MFWDASGEEIEVRPVENRAPYERDIIALKGLVAKGFYSSAKFDVAQPDVLSTPKISAQTAMTLQRLQDARKGRLHAKSLNDLVVDPNEAKSLKEIAGLFVRSQRDFRFDDLEESQRIRAIDYLGEKLLGRVDTERHDLVLNTLQRHLKFDALEGSFDKRKKQSLIGDQIEIMQYLAMWDQDFAIRTLSKFTNSKRYKFLETGIFNGLWQKGLSEAQIKHLLNSA